jgi:hypothetical protein
MPIDEWFIFRVIGASIMGGLLYGGLVGAIVGVIGGLVIALYTRSSSEKSSYQLPDSGHWSTLPPPRCPHRATQCPSLPTCPRVTALREPTATRCFSPFPHGRIRRTSVESPPPAASVFPELPVGYTPALRGECRVVSDQKLAPHRKLW